MLCNRLVCVMLFMAGLDGLGAYDGACFTEPRPGISPIPIHVALLDPDGAEVTPYDRYTAIDPHTGVATVTFPRARQMDPAAWTGGLNTWFKSISSMGSTHVKQS